MASNLPRHSSNGMFTSRKVSGSVWLTACSSLVNLYACRTASPSSCRLRPPPSLFLKTDDPPTAKPGPEGASPPVGDPLGPAVSGGGGAEMAGRKTMAGQMAWWPRRTIIYRNSAAVRLKEREGEVAWVARPASHPSPPGKPTYHTQRLDVCSLVFFFSFPPSPRLFCASLAVSKTNLLVSLLRVSWVLYSRTHAVLLSESKQWLNKSHRVS